MTLLYSPSHRRSIPPIYFKSSPGLNAISWYNKLSPILGEDINSLTYIQRAS